MTITNENIFQADYEVAETWRGHNGANDQENRQLKKIIVPEQFKGDVAALCEYSGLTELTPGLTLSMSLKEASSVLPRKRKRINSYNTLIRFLNGEMGVSLIINSQKSKKHGK